MRTAFSFIVPVVMALAALSPQAAHAQRSEHDRAFRDMRAGEIQPLDRLIRGVSPHVRGSFVGSDYNSRTRTYRLKYMQEGRMVWVDVDARSGQIIRSTDR